MVSQIPEIPRLHCVAPVSASHVALCEPAQLFVNGRRELIDRRCVPAADRGEQPGEPDAASVMSMPP